jgi:predicted DNA-binding transcriptional regulator YafY
MSRTERLLRLMQLLRERKYPVKGEILAENLGISLRSLYRDIRTLQAQGVRVQGEAGLGFLLLPGYTLPPLSFSEEELEALVLGSRWVMRKTDRRLASAAHHALLKIRDVLPEERRRDLELEHLRIVEDATAFPEPIDLSIVRQAIRKERKLEIQYRSEAGVLSKRIVWPIAIGYLERLRVLAAWCETRKDFRHFRSDLILKVQALPQEIPHPRSLLLARWKKTQKGLLETTDTI